MLGEGLSQYCREPFIEDEAISWRECRSESLDADIVAPVAKPFDAEGGLRLVEGPVGRAMVKVSAVSPEHHSITAPARVFASQDDFRRAFNDGELETDFVAVLPGQGPCANGMPELHKLTPYLGVLQNRGFKVALLTDGRMSGASGKVLAAIQVTPEALRGGDIGRIRDGDTITIDSEAGVLSVESSENLSERPDFDGTDAATAGVGRELFGVFRRQSSSAEEGASFFFEALR